jgi:ABC-type amino acid transport substrate-binding protein
VIRRTSKVAISLAALSVLTIAACSSSGHSGSNGQTSTQSGASAGYKLVTPGTLTVATPGQYPPLVIEGPHDTLSGVEGDWAVAFAKAQGLKIKLFQTSFAGTILAVEQHKADLAMSLIYTPERAKQVRYTYPSDIEGLQIFTKPSFDYTGPSSLSGKSVGTVTGYAWTDTLLKAFGTRLHIYQTVTDGEKALQNGQITAFFEGVPVVVQLSGMVGHNPKGGDYGIPGSEIHANDYDIVACDNPKLADALNQELSTLFSGSGWSAILKKNKIGPNDLTAQRPALKSPKQVCS